MYPFLSQLFSKKLILLLSTLSKAATQPTHCCFPAVYITASKKSILQQHKVPIDRKTSYLGPGFPAKVGP